MLDSSPCLASDEWRAEKKTITNKAGQRIVVEGKTGYEYALGEDDHEIAKMLKTCIIKTEGKQKADALFNAQFAEGWEKSQEKRWRLAFIRLETLTHTIRDAKQDDITSSGAPDYNLTIKKGSAVAIADAQFIISLNAILEEPVTIGLHFNPNLFQKALDIYHTHYANHFGNSRQDPRAILFWRRGAGYDQRLMPANYGQMFCGDGLYKNIETLEKGEPQHCSLSLMVYQQTDNSQVSLDLYPLEDSNNSGLGFDFAVNGSKQPKSTCEPGRMSTAFLTFTTIKNQQRDKLKPENQPPTKPTSNTIS